MSQDFVTALRLQLREAAEREARRGPLRRTLPQLRPLVPAGALAAAAVVVVIALSTAGSSTPRPTSPAPHVVARLAIADKGGSLSLGFGSLWSYDAVSGDVLRLSRDGTVVARIPTQSDILDGWLGAGSMWALTEDHLYRIDPRTNRVVARIKLPPPTRWYGGVFPFKDAVWLVSSSDMLNVDLATNRIGRKVSIANAGVAAHAFAADESAFYIVRIDGTLVTLDGRTAKRIALGRIPYEDKLYSAHRGTLIVSAGAGVGVVDSRTGKQAWRSNLGTSRINGVAFGLGAIWVQGTPVSGRDQLWKLDPKTGRVLAALPVPDFGVAGMTVAGGRVWIMSPNGNLTAVR